MFLPLLRSIFCYNTNRKMMMMAKKCALHWLLLVIISWVNRTYIVAICLLQFYIVSHVHLINSNIKLVGILFWFEYYSARSKGDKSIIMIYKTVLHQVKLNYVIRKTNGIKWNCYRCCRFEFYMLIWFDKVHENTSLSISSYNMNIVLHSFDGKDIPIVRGS